MAHEPPVPPEPKLFPIGERPDIPLELRYDPMGKDRSIFAPERDANVKSSGD